MTIHIINKQLYKTTSGKPKLKSQFRFKTPRSEQTALKKSTFKEGAPPPPWGRNTGRSELAAAASKRGPKTLLPPRVPPPGLKLSTVFSGCIPCKSSNISTPS